MKKNITTLNSYLIMVMVVVIMLFTNSLNANAQEPIVEEPDEPATFPGGMVPMLSFLSQNIKYPEEAKEKNIQGRVQLQFIVETDGTLSDIKVLRSVDPIIDAEAIRAVSAMPKWTPAIKDGHPVRTVSYLPIHFRVPAPPKDAILINYAKGENGKKVVNCTLTSKSKLSEQEQAAIIEMKDVDSKIKEMSKKNKEGFFVLPNNPETMDEFNTIEEMLGKLDGIDVVFKQD